MGFLTSCNYVWSLTVLFIPNILLFVKKVGIYIHMTLFGMVNASDECVISPTNKAIDMHEWLQLSYKNSFRQQCV